MSRFHWTALLAWAVAVECGAAVPSSITLGSSSSVVRYGAPVTLTATVTPAAANGKVTFYSGVSVLGMAPVVSGMATFTTASLDPGTLSLKAHYSGDAAYAPSNSTAIIVAINAVSSQGFNMVYSPAGTYLNFPRLTSGDFNGDGKMDVAVTNSGPQSVILYLAAGNGLLTAGNSYPGGMELVDLAAADFNGDGKTDLVVLDYSGSSVRVMLGNGDGSLQPAVTYPVQGLKVKTGDFNGDGAVDLAVCNRSDGASSISILLGKGDGSFPAAVPYPAGGFSGAMEVADVNGDGVADLVSAKGANDLGVMRGVGDGTFQAIASVSSFSASVYSIAAADINNDGKVDLSVSADNKVFALRGNGDGTFSTSSSVDVGALCERLRATDMDGDGNADVLAETPFSGVTSPTPSSFVILFGDGTGSLRLGQYHDRLPGYSPGVVGDFNDDGRVDRMAWLSPSFAAYLGLGPTDLSIACAHTGDFKQGQSGAVYTITVTNAGPSASSGVVAATDTLPSGMTFAKASGTGWDCSGLGQTGTCTRSDSLAPGASFPVIVLEANVSVTASPRLYNEVKVSISTQSDTNPGNDSISDLTTVLQYQSIVFGTLSDLLFGAPPFTLTAMATSGLPVAFSSSGECTVTGNTVTLTAAGACTITASQAGDALYLPAANVARTFRINATSTSVMLSAGSGASALGTPVVLTASVSPAEAQGVVVFLDGNTPLGIANVSGGSATSAIRLTGTGIRTLRARYTGGSPYAGSLSNAVAHTVKSVASFAFQPALLTIGSYSSGIDVVAADLNGDGFPDLVTAISGGVAVFPSDGAGGFGPAITSADSGAVGLRPVQIAAGDFNGDGRTDIAISYAAVGQAQPCIRARSGNGNGTFGPATNYPVAEAGPLAVSDFNGDGLADLAIGQGSAHSVAVLPAKADGTFAAPLRFSVVGDDSTILLAAGDMNQDGNADLVVVTVQSGINLDSQINVLLGRGDCTFAQPAAPVKDLVQSSFPPGGLVIGDLNGDDILDVVIQNGFSYVPYRSSISALLGNGDGTLKAPIRANCSDATGAGTSYMSSATGQPSGMVMADFDGDGVQDIAGVFRYGSGFIQIWPGNGDGTFRPASVHISPKAPVSPYGLITADFDGDGRGDLAATASTGISVLKGAAGPSLRATMTHSGGAFHGQRDLTYTVTVSNATGASATDGMVSVVIPDPGYGSFRSRAGAGWNCQIYACTRSDSLAGGSSYPPITAVMDVGYSGVSPLITRAAVFGGGSPPLMVTDTAEVIQPGATSTISSVNVAGATGSGIVQNGWIEIKGTKLVPATTPAAGVIWSNAPDFASGRMPTQLSGVSVTVNGKPAYVYFYCSASTSQICNSDQVNVLTPLDDTMGEVTIVVTGGGVSSAPFTVAMNPVAPAFLRFGGTRYVTATHADYRLLGPTSLYTGLTTPAKPSEVVILWAAGFGLPATPLTAGSSTQTGPLMETPACTVGGNPAAASAYLVSPGLYQINLTIPAGTADGDNPVRCTYRGSTTAGGSWIAVRK